MNPYEVIINPLMTEKVVRLMETENKLLFRVNIKATKSDIKKAIEEMFKVKVEKINTLIGREGKKAYIRLTKDFNAVDIATKLGLM